MPEKKIFLSYRREDSSGQAGRLADRLIREFGEDRLFMDVDGIPLGVDFVQRLTEEVASCDVLLAVIGPRWIELCNENGQRRLDDPNDFVRVEISAALQRDIPVIPILLDGTKIPRAHQLPDDLKRLPLRNGLDLRHASFHDDLNKLVRSLKPTSPVPSETIAASPEKTSRIGDETSRSSVFSSTAHWILGWVLGFIASFAAALSIAQTVPDAWKLKIAAGFVTLAIAALLPVVTRLSWPRMVGVFGFQSAFLGLLIVGALEKQGDDAVLAPLRLAIASAVLTAVLIFLARLLRREKPAAKA